MKKSSLIVCFLLLIPAAAHAQEKTLYDIAQDMFALVEAYTACAAGDSACTGDDALALQAEAENSLRDLAKLIRSGSVQQMIISTDQACILSERASSMRGRLAHIELFDAQCNRSILLMMQALFSMGQVLWLMMYFFAAGIIGEVCLGCYVIAIALTPLLLISMIFVLGAFVLMAPCLFWWL